MSNMQNYNKIKIKGAIIVEGKYDKIKLDSFIDGVIIVTNGFNIFKDKEKLELIRKYAHREGVIILTDSDNAGRQIRDYLKQAVGGSNIRNFYIPEILGKEKRKLRPSKSGMIGVEGIDREILEKIFLDNDNNSKQVKKYIFNREMLFDDGFIGKKESAGQRKLLLRELKLPQNLSVNTLLETLNSLYTIDDYKNAIALIRD